VIFNSQGKLTQYASGMCVCVYVCVCVCMIFNSQGKLTQYASENALPRGIRS